MDTKTIKWWALEKLDTVHHVAGERLPLQWACDAHERAVTGEECRRTGESGIVYRLDEGAVTYVGFVTDEEAVAWASAALPLGTWHHTVVLHVMD